MRQMIRLGSGIEIIAVDSASARVARWSYSNASVVRCSKRVAGHLPESVAS